MSAYEDDAYAMCCGVTFDVHAHIAPHCHECPRCEEPCHCSDGALLCKHRCYVEDKANG